jgi:hypothetical protein
MPTSPRPFQNQYKKRANSDDVFNKPKDMVMHTDLQNERKELYKRWITFYRRNPHRFVTDYFGIHLYPYQVLMIHVLQKSNLAYIVASRASAKTWLIAVWSLTLAVLYPGIKIIVCAKTLKQGGILISEKIRQLQDAYPNVAREIRSLTANANVYEVTLQCGSTIKVVPSSDSSRGNRANYIIVEEARLVPKEILEAVIKPFLEVRNPPYRLKAQYSDDNSLLEEGIISYITSAWYTAEYWYQYVKTAIRRMVDGDSTASFMALDYLICLRHNIKTKAMLKNEMADMDSVSIQMEYLNIPAGSSSKAYYKPRMFSRNLKSAFYPQKEDTYNPKKNPYQIDKVSGEIRILSVDVATRAGKANDLSIISVARLIPLLGKGYERNLVYIESFKGINTLTQAKRIKEIFFDFEADHLVLDLQNAGISVFDALSRVTTSDERGIDFPPFTVTNDMFVDDKIRQELLERTLGVEALPVIYPISASQSSNSIMYSALRNSLQKKMWKFLVSEGDAEDFLVKSSNEFRNNSNETNVYGYFMSPYVNTSLLISECINLDMTLVGGLVKLSEKPGAYKDRFSSLLYMNYIVSEFDKQLMKESEVTNDLETLMSVTFFN